MAVLFQVSDIVEDIRQRMGLPAFTASTNVTDAQVLRWIQQSARALSAMTRQKFGRDFDLLQTATLTTVPNFNLVSLPAEFGELYRLVWVKDSHEFFELEEASVHQLEPIGWNPREWDCPPTYRLEGQTITLYPCPNAVETLQAWYSTHIMVSSSSDTFNGRLDWDAWIALRVCELITSHRDADPTRFVQERLMLEQSLFAPARKRDQNAVHTMRDVRDLQASHARRRGY